MSLNLTHDPAARLDYQWDWSSWLEVGETITDTDISVLPPDDLVVDLVTNTPETVTAWISGGINGRTYQVSCHVVTSADREDDRRITLAVRDR